MGGMTYENVAKLIGQIENARGVPSLDTLVKISGALGVTVDQLLKENYVNPEMVYLKEISERIAAYSARQRIMACESLLNYLDSLEKFNQ
jgi:transcriptional regulator with XRE-family HTH domain